MTTPASVAEYTPKPSAGALWLAGAVAIAFTLANRAAVLSIVWGWFIADHFDVPTLGVLDAAGVCLVATVLLRVGSDERRSDEAMTPARVLRGAVVTSVLLWVAAAIAAVVEVLRG